MNQNVICLVWALSDMSSIKYININSPRVTTDDELFRKMEPGKLYRLDYSEPLYFMTEEQIKLAIDNENKVFRSRDESSMKNAFELTFCFLRKVGYRLSNRNGSIYFGVFLLGDRKIYIGAGDLRSHNILTIDEAGT